MQAIINERYGPPESLQLKEIELPAISADQILVKVYAASVNPFDWHKMRGSPYIMRFMEGLLKPNDSRLGADMAGIVEAVGGNVTQFKQGDAVYGDISSGSFAEYAVTTEKHVAPKPSNIDFASAAAVPIAGLTAIQCLRDHAALQPGERILINGASGGVGSYAVQIAKAIGAEVTGVCSGRNVELVYSLGADHVIDYTQEKFTENGKEYDVILDNVANHSYRRLLGSLAPAGRCVTIGFSLSLMAKVALFGNWTYRRTGKKIVSMLAKIRQADLLELNKLFEAGQLKSVIDRSYPLVETAAAIRYQETGRARGKVIVAVATMM